MTLFWLWVCAGCAASAAVGFSLVRFAVPSVVTFRAAGGNSSARQEAPGEPVAAHSAVLDESAPQLDHDAPAEAVVATRERPAAASAVKRRSPSPRPPRPTAPEPEAAKLALWARQVKAGERKMSIATDGCRVTWDRTCKHGHPTWLVRLGYLERPRPARPPRLPR